CRSIARWTCCARCRTAPRTCRSAWPSRAGKMNSTWRPMSPSRWSSAVARFVRPMLGALLATLLPVGAGAAHGESASRPALLDYGAIQHPVRAERAMVVSQNVIASQVGADILKRGGNAIDAAVGVGFALAVTLPRAGNLGGDGYMLVHIGETGETLVVDYRSIAPMAAHVGLFSESQGGDPADLRRGYRASGVPGTVAGLEAAHR